MFQSTRTFEILQSTSTFFFQFKYSTSNFTGITKPSSMKKSGLFKKHSDFEIPVKSSVSYLNYYIKIVWNTRFLVLFDLLARAG